MRLPKKSAVSVYSWSNATFVNSEKCFIHSPASSHGLPNFAEVIYIMSKDNALVKHWFSKNPLVNELKGDIFANDVTIVDEKEHFFCQ